MTTSGTASAPGTPDAEVDIDNALVRRLLTEQHPDLAEEAIELAAHGWDNAMFRLGDSLAVRLPRRKASAQLIENEQRWLPEIAARVDVLVPAPVRVGIPGCGYPWSWSVIPWTSGTSCAEQPLAAEEATRLGSLLRQLHVPAPRQAPSNPFRGVPIEERSDSFEQRLIRLVTISADLDVASIRRVWQEAVAAQRTSRHVWIHGDLHPRNVISTDGKLTAVIDWGDLTAGDPATDLAAVWMHFPTASHKSFWQAYGETSAALTARARGWAAFFGVVLLDSGLANDEVFARVGRLILERVVSD